MRIKKVYYWVAVLIVIDIATVGLIGKTYADNANITKANHIVKMDNWGINIDVPIDTVQNLNKLGNKEVSLDTSETVTVAPGDSDGVGYTINGKPAVSAIDVVCQYDITIVNPEKWKVDDEYYFPVEFAIEADSMDEAAGWENKSYTVASVPVNILVDDSKYNKIEVATEDNVLKVTTTERLTQSNTYTKYKGVAWGWKFYVDDEKDAQDTKLGNYVDEAPQFKLQSNITLTWDDGVSTATTTTATTPTVTDDYTDEYYEDTTSTTVSTQSDETSAAVTPSRTLSGDTANNAIVPDRTLSGNTSDNNTDANAINPGRTLSGAVNTGDSFNLALWVSLMALATVTILAMIILIIKRNKNDKDEKSLSN